MALKFTHFAPFHFEPLWLAFARKAAPQEWANLPEIVVRGSIKKDGYRCACLIGFTTNRELGMMLRLEKPLAVFCDVGDVFPPVLLRYSRMFDRHVLAGRLVKREHREIVELRGKRHTLLTILYALPEEGWRIDAMLELRRNDRPWTKEHERREGALLGYTNAQNDAWIASRYSVEDGAP